MKRITTICIIATAVGVLFCGGFYNAGADTAAAWTGLMLCLLWMLHSALAVCRLETAEDKISVLSHRLSRAKTQKAHFIDIEGKRIAEEKNMTAAVKAYCHDVFEELFSEKAKAESMRAAEANAAAMTATFFNEV